VLATTWPTHAPSGEKRAHRSTDQATRPFGAIECGIAKINFGTELKNAFTLAVKNSLLATDEIDLRKTFTPAITAVSEVSAEKIRICQRATLQ